MKAATPIAKIATATIAMPAPGVVPVAAPDVVNMAAAALHVPAAAELIVFSDVVVAAAVAMLDQVTPVLVALTVTLRMESTMLCSAKS